MDRFLITGCQRSGTTLMGLIMNSHPLIKNVDEADFKSIDNLSVDFHSCAKLPKESANINFIKNKYKPDCIIWMVRNPFDVIKSMMSLQISRSRSNTESWGRTFVHVEINSMLQYLPSEILSPHQQLLDQYRDILANDMLKNSEQGSVLSCITCWALKQECYKYLQASGLNIVALRYEDLVTSPKIVLPELFKKLNVDWHDDLLRHHELHNGLSIGNTLNSRAIDKSSLFYSQRFFYDSELKLISDLTATSRKAFLYPAFNTNSEFDKMLPNNKAACSQDLLLFQLSLAFNQKQAKSFISVISKLLNDKTKLSDFVLDNICEYLNNPWVVQLLSKDEHTSIMILLCDLLEQRKVKLVKPLLEKLAIENPLWGIYSSWKFKDIYTGELAHFYNADNVNHPRFATALAVVIGNQGDILGRDKQWDCLFKLSERFPKLSIIRSIATNLSNTLPNRKDINSVLMQWNQDDNTAASFRQSLFKLTPRRAIDISNDKVDQFEVLNIETLYMAWRLGRSDQIKALADANTKFSKVANSFLNATAFEDFEGRDHIYFGKRNPKKLIVVFTGLASMLMYPPALIHALIDLPSDSGVLWLQDVHARAYMSGPDGKSSPYKYEDYIVQLVRDIGPSQVSVIGSSAGGTISLHFSSIFPTYRSVSLSPYTFLEVGGSKDRLQKSFASVFSGRVDLLPALGSKTTPTRVYYGADCQRDVDNAERLKDLDHVTLVPVEGGETHHTGEQLALQGLYSEIFNWLVEGELEEPFWGVQKEDNKATTS